MLAEKSNNKGVEEKLTRRIEELMVVHQISHTMNSSLNVKETLESVMDAVIDLTHADRALMYLRDEDSDNFAPRISRGKTEDIELDFTVETSKSIFKHIVKSREPMIVDDIAADKRVNQDYAAKVKTKGFVLVPMISKERVIGIIGLDNLVSQRPLSEINLDLLVTLANHAAIALTNNRLFEKTQRFNDELQVKVKEATEHLEQLLEMKSHFLTVASHQLRTPTTIVKGLLSMVVEDPDMPAEQKMEYIEQAYTSMNRLEGIISDLLTATELEDASAELLAEETQLAVMLNELVQNLEPLAKERGIKLEIHIPKKDPGLIITDRSKLYEAISNLVDNAIRYTEKGKVKVKLETTAEHAKFSITDTGIGLAQKEHEAIFEKFHRGDDALEIEPNGTGLGLFITKRVIDLLNGEIAVESKGKGKGTTFVVHVPINVQEKAVDTVA
ncbi:ATP-binding protein [Patescibacteria group bacterium]